VLTEQQLLNNILFPATVTRPILGTVSNIDFFVEAQVGGLHFIQPCNGGW
jgi:hypothetical protein